MQQFLESPWNSNYRRVKIIQSLPPQKKMLEIFNVHETILRTTVQNFFCLLPSAAFVSSVLSWKALLQLVWKTYLKVFEKSNRQHYHIDDCLEDNREDCQNYPYVNYIFMHVMEFLQFQVQLVFFCVCVEVKLTIPLLCVCAILPAKAVPKMTCTVSGGTLNPTHSLTHIEKSLKSP